MDLGRIRWRIRASRVGIDQALEGQSSFVRVDHESSAP